MTVPGATCSLLKVTMASLIAAFVLTIAPNQVAACACCDTYQVVGVEDWDVLNVRAGPSTRYPIVGEFPPGTCGLRVLKVRGRWLKVQLGGVRGWVSGRYVEFR